jgi:hypothetical protein
VSHALVCDCCFRVLLGMEGPLAPVTMTNNKLNFVARRPRINLACGRLVFVFLLLVAAQSVAHAGTFTFTTVDNGDKLYLDAVDKQSPATATSPGTGHFSSQTDPRTVSIAPVLTSTISLANGWSTIKPVDGLLKELIFTPADPTLFGNFLTRGQLSNSGGVEFVVMGNAAGDVEQTFKSTDFLPVIGHDSDWDAMGIVSTDDSIKYVKIFALDSSGHLGNDFKEVKQITLSLESDDSVNHHNVGTPEPGSLVVWGLLALLGGTYFSRRRIAA